MKKLHPLSGKASIWKGCGKKYFRLFLTSKASLRWSMLASEKSEKSNKGGKSDSGEDDQ